MPLKPKNKYVLFSKAAVFFFLALSVFIFTGKSSIVDFLRLPLQIGSSFLADVKAVVTYKFIYTENLKLKNELSQLKSEVVLLNELRLENERLRKLLSIKKDSYFNSVAAKVIARDPNSWSSGLVLNAGIKQGVKHGSIVISESGLAGRVVDVSAQTSKVILINDPNSAVACIIQRSRVEGLATGTLSGEVFMRYLQKDSDVVVGDVILASGLAADYPGPVLVGRVSSIRREQGGLGLYCLISPAADLNRIEEVLVLIEK